jgi:recombinational DNA repair protein (RecF pathway)
MAYQTYITEALVCGSWHSNTADKSILLFAREAGMVYVQAKSIREERSKQRFALQDASLARVTLIRGKTGWKVAGAESLRSFYAEAKSREARAFLRDTILLLRRVMQGETPHPDIFDDVMSVFEKREVVSYKAVEALLFARTLNVLGYVAPEAVHAPYFGTEFPFDQASALPENAIAELETIIENALTQSQL